MTNEQLRWIEGKRGAYYSLTGANLIVIVDDSTEIENFGIEIIKPGYYDEYIGRFETFDEVKLYIHAMFKQAMLDNQWK